MIVMLFMMKLGVMQVVTPPEPLPPPPPPQAVFRSVDLPEGARTLVVDRAPADGRDALETTLEEAAAKQCGALPMVLGEFTYNQSIDGDGNPAAEMTEITQNFHCGDAAPKATPQ